MRGARRAVSFPRYILCAETALREAGGFANYLADLWPEDSRPLSCGAVRCIRDYAAEGNSVAVRLFYLVALVRVEGFRGWALRSDPERVAPLVLWAMRAVDLWLCGLAADGSVPAPLLEGSRDGRPGSMPAVEALRLKPAYPCGLALVCQAATQLRTNYDPFGCTAGILAGRHREAFLSECTSDPAAILRKLQLPAPGRPLDLPEEGAAAMLPEGHPLRARGPAARLTYH